MNAASSPPRRELLALAALALLYLAVNALTLARYPLPWVDELQFADPAINWVSGRGFTSTVWIAQPADAFWAGNAPLYTLLLCAWLWLWGTAAEAVRSLNLLMVLGLAGGAWALALRRGWLLTSGTRLLFVALLLLGHGITFSVRMGRYDLLGMLLMLAAVGFWTAPPSRMRLVGLVAVAALAPAACLALLPAALLYLGVAVLLQGREALARAAAVLAGLALGALLLWAFFTWHGVWDAFRASTSAVGVIGQGLTAKLAGLPRVYLADKSLLLLMLAMLLLPWPRSARFALLLLALLPGALQLAGKFPLYYAWMVYAPLALALCMAVERAAPLPRWRRLGVQALLALAMGVGLPLRLAGIAALWPAIDPKLSEAYAQRWLRPDDRLVADFKGYYAARGHAQHLFTPTALQVMRADERSAVTALWIRPDELPRVRAALGGDWQEAAPRLAAGSMVPGLWHRLLRELSEQNYPLALYRRLPDRAD